MSRKINNTWGKKGFYKYIWCEISVHPYENIDYGITGKNNLKNIKEYETWTERYQSVSNI